MIYRLQKASGDERFTASKRLTKSQKMKLSKIKMKTLLKFNKSIARNKDADVENGLEDTGRGKGKLGRSERVAWTCIHYQM